MATTTIPVQHLGPDYPPEYKTRLGVHRDDRKQQTTGGGPSTSQIVAILTLLPIGGTLLLLAGLTLAGTLIGLAVATPLFIIFSPILIPAVLIIGLSVTGFLTSGALGITGLSSLSWMANYLRKMRPQEDAEYLKRRLQETAGHIGQKTKETGQVIQQKAYEGGRAAHEGGGGGEKSQEGGKGGEVEKARETRK